MRVVPEPSFWETSGFWAAIYLFVMLYVVVRETFGKDEAARRPILRRVLLAAGAIWPIFDTLIQGDEC